MADGSFISAQQFEGVRPLVSLVYNSMGRAKLGTLNFYTEF